MDTNDKEQPASAVSGGLWTETRDPTTGRSSLELHTPKVVWQGCKPGSCKWVLTEDARIVQCRVCRAERRLVIGYHAVEGGDIREYDSNSS